MFNKITKNQQTSCVEQRCVIDHQIQHFGSLKIIFSSLVISFDLHYEIIKRININLYKLNLTPTF